MTKKEIVAKILGCDDFYHALGYLTAGSAWGIMSQLWMMYYSFRVKADMPISEALQLEELKLRVTSVQNTVVDTTFWEVRTMENGYALCVTYATNAAWNETCKTFTADDVHDAKNFCCVVLGLNANDIYILDAHELDTIDDLKTLIL